MDKKSKQIVQEAVEKGILQGFKLGHDAGYVKALENTANIIGSLPEDLFSKERILHILKIASENIPK